MTAADLNGQRHVGRGDDPFGSLLLPTATKWVDRVAQTVRVTSHTAVWMCIWLPVLVVLDRGWRPLGDYAAIELQAYRTFSLHPPLVGMYSTAGFGVGHTVFDPGPLVLWMLSVPVRVDPVHGLVWGAALLWGLVLSLAIEAMWSAGRWGGCGLIAVVVVDLLFTAPSVVDDVAWNPVLPLPFLIAAMAMAYLVIRGRYSWWPVLVFVGSVAAQTHLFFVLPAVGLVVLAPLLGVQAAGRPERFRWMVAGLGVAVMCWIGPAIQSFGSHSNVAALSRGTDGVATLGFGFGLRVLGGSASVFPIWLRHIPTGFYPTMAFAFGHSPATGIVALGGIVAVTAFAGLTRRRGLYAAGMITLVLTSALLVSFASVPKTNLIVVAYLIYVAWVEGLFLWTVGIWGICSAGRSLVGALNDRQRSRRGTAPDARKISVEWAETPAAVLCGGALLGLIAGASTLALATSTEAKANFGSNWSTSEQAQAARVVSLVEHAVPRGAVTVTFETSPSYHFQLSAIGEGVGLQLVLDGWDPGLRGIDSGPTSLPPLPDSPGVFIRVTASTVISVRLVIPFIAGPACTICLVSGAKQ